MIISLDDNWKFFKGDMIPFSGVGGGWGGAKAKGFFIGASSASYDDAKWRTVNIPHDFVCEGDYTRKEASSDMGKIPEMESIDSRHFAGGSLEGGVAWYRKHFTLPNGSTEKRIILNFDGVYRNAEVYLNNYLVGTHISGYSAFSFDITDFAAEGENVLAVRVDSTGREGWWYEGGGICCPVYVTITEKIAADEGGIFVRGTVDDDGSSAAAIIETAVVNKTLAPAKAEIISSIYDSQNRKIAETSDTVTIDMWDSAKLKQRIELGNVRLWDIDDPYLYTLKTEIRSGDSVDTTKTQFGFKTIRFDSDRGFFLNGRHVRIQGLCCHRDHAGLGIADDYDVWEYRLTRLKSMGMNALRSSHHMPSKSVRELCDKLGILLFAETRRMSSSKEDTDAIRTMVKRCRNHPSVFLYGIGNEEIFSQDAPETKRTTITLRTEIRKLDPTRPVTSAVVCWNGTQRFENAASYVDITKELDVMGFNYCLGAWDDYHERMPKQPIIITEASSNSWTRSCYSTNEALGQYYVYDRENTKKCKFSRKADRLEMGESEWKYFAEREYLSGIFLWTGIDYRGEPTPLSYPAVYSQFGILDYCGFENDNYYYYKSWWQDGDVLHIFPHWNLDAGTVTDVHIYSNFDEAELFVNGKSLGKKHMEKNWYLTWENVKYVPGEITVVGYRNGSPAGRTTVKTTGEPYALRLTPFKDNVRKTAVIKAEILDKTGNVVPTADNTLSFTARGGEIVGTGNGNPGDHDSEKTGFRRAFNGLALVLAAPAADTMTVRVSAHGLMSAECEITADNK